MMLEAIPGPLRRAGVVLACCGAVVLESGLAWADAAPGATAGPPRVELTDKQQFLIKVGPVGTHSFRIEKSAIGSVDFDEDREVQVLSPYQGRITAVFVQLGDKVTAGQPLYAIDSPDLVQAESTLIQAAGVLDLTNRALARARRLVPAGGGAQKDLEQAVSDQQTAEGNLNAARNALLIFGKSRDEIDHIAADRRPDTVLTLRSPLDGVVVSRAAAPGLFLQAGGTPAPVAVADVSVKWMIANFTEADVADIRVGQEVIARALPEPDRVFHGKVSAVGESIDPATRRFIVRFEVRDPDNVLRPGMFVSFVISTGRVAVSAAMPPTGVVREGDGTMTAWVTQDRHHFEQRVIRLGLQQDNLDQVLSGLGSGELAVTDGAVYLNNMLEASPSD
jgi:membrane fusion protein, heavy metal efflux system